MTANKVLFEDGSSVEWKNRESLKYIERGYVALVWVDYEPGFFNNGRILKMSSLRRWYEAPPGSSLEISKDKKKEIISKIQDYYCGKSVRVSNED